MANPFAAVIKNARNNQLSRHYGGTGSSVVADPYISGYHFIKWIKIPANLLGVLVLDRGTLASTQFNSKMDVQNFLEGSCLAVTPPGGTLNKTEFTGLGGIKWSVPTNIDYTNTLTIKFLEFHHLPVLSIFHSWIRLIRDFKAGTSNLNTSNDAYSKDAYAGSLYYWTTKPDGRTVEYAACYTGVFPTKDPQDLYSGDLSAIDKLEVDIEFSIDMAFHEHWVLEKCQSLAQQHWSASRSLIPMGPHDYNSIE